MSEKRGSPTPYMVMVESLQNMLGNNPSDREREKTIPQKWEKLGDLVLLPNGSFNNWGELLGESLWLKVADALGAKRVAKKGEISGPERRPQVELLLGNHGMVSHREHGIQYAYDVTKSMFSAGNLAERGRIGELDCAGEVILDLYSGIGYYTLPILVKTGAEKVHACEWSEDAVEALQTNLELNGVSNRCEIYPGDNRITFQTEVAKNEIINKCDRILLGLIPSSEEGWSLAISAIKPEGGVLHLHGNSRGGKENEWADRVISQLENLPESDGYKFELIRLIKVKWYSPHIRHCVADIRIVKAAQ